MNIYDYFLGDRITEGRGDRTALLSDAGATSYDDVHAGAGRVASLLADLGVSPGDRVLIALPDGVDYVTTLFGVLRRGAVVVMVNPHLSPDQVTYFIDYTTPSVLITNMDGHASCAAAMERADHPSQLLLLDDPEIRSRLDAAPADSEVYPTSPDAPAVFLFSGGTTGHPKAVVQTHRSFANTTKLYGQDVLALTEDDVTLSVPKLFFGYATGTNLFFPFSVGATSALFSERCTADELFRRIEQWRPTVLVNVPTMVNNLLADESAGGRDVSSLRLATSAGEALPEELHRRWDERFGVPLLDGLGTAEMWHIFISNRPDDVRPGTLGRVVDGFEVLACDDEGNEVATGEVGVMRVRGDSLALGYWQDEEKSQSAFRDGWYVSSDMISIDDAGYVTYGGRADDMLKVSGKWLSPKELENCLLEHDAVREAAVVGVRTTDGLVKPSAFVVLRDRDAASDALAAELQSWAKERLEPYKYPRSVTFLLGLPRTHLGKVDRGRLGRSGSTAE
ncbi:MAG: benzoate-CoA ligase family protein [Gemmatimonadota bacterium]